MEWLRNLFKIFKSREDSGDEVNMLQPYINDPDYDVFHKDGKIVIEHHPERKPIREAFNALSPEEKNAIGKTKGYGGCNHCGGTWNWKRAYHSISYTKTSGYSGLCDECWAELSPEERILYFKKWLKRWKIDEVVDWKLVRKTAGMGKRS